MKTKKLIELLQNADPSGELECCIDNEDILHVGVLPAYYDGHLQIINRDKNGQITDAKFVSTGHKVQIDKSSIRDLIFEYSKEDLVVDYGTNSERYKSDIDKEREEVKRINNKVEREGFVDWIVKKMDVKESQIKNIAEQFYNEHMSYKDPMPNDIKFMKRKEKDRGKEYSVIPSWRARRELQWDREINLKFVDNELVIRRRPI